MSKNNKAKQTHKIIASILAEYTYTVNQLASKPDNSLIYQAYKILEVLPHTQQFSELQQIYLDFELN